MSYWTRKKQLTYLSVAIAIILIIFLVFIFLAFSKTPNCYDGKWNGNEEGVDCGGDCALVCRDNALNLVNWWERPFQVSSGVYNLVAYIENQNIDSGIREAVYEFRVYDANNVLIGEPILGSTFIEPNTKSAIFEPGFFSSGRVPHTVFLHWDLRNQFEQVGGDTLGSPFVIENKLLEEERTAPRLSAVVKNTTLMDLENIDVVAILYAKSGNAIAASQTFIASLPGENSATVNFSWNSPFDEKVANIEIIPRVSPFK